MPPGNFSYQSHSAQSRTFDIGDSYRKVALLSLLDVTKVQDGGTYKKRITSTKMFCWQSWATEALCYEKKTPKKDNNFYDIEVTEDDKEIICIKINFVGYGNEFDELRDFDVDSDQLPFVLGICPHWN